MKNPEADWDETTLTFFGHKDYGIRSERYRYIAFADGTEELYDHKKRSLGMENLANNPEYVEVKKAMRQELPTRHEPE